MRIHYLILPFLIQIPLIAEEARDVSKIYPQSFICQCNPKLGVDFSYDTVIGTSRAIEDDLGGLGSTGTGTTSTSCSKGLGTSISFNDFEWLPVITNGDGACSGINAPSDCTEILTKELNDNLYNWLPVHPEVALLMRGLTVGEISANTRSTPGVCDLKFSKRDKVVEIPNSLKGDYARRALYLIGRYNIAVSDSYMEKLLRWDKEDAVTKNEYQTSKLIGDAQGSDNAFVSMRYRQSMSNATNE